MGTTTGALGFVYKDGAKRSAYNHYDSYPRQLGKGISDFLRTCTEADFDLMSDRVENLQWVDQYDGPDLEQRELYIPLDFYRRERQYMTSETGFGPLPKPEPSQDISWQYLLGDLRKRTWKCLQPIKENRLSHLIQSDDFENNDCEWAYFLDFNKRILTIYGDWGEKPETVSFSFLQENPEWMMRYSLTQEQYDWVERVDADERARQAAWHAQHALEAAAQAQVAPEPEPMTVPAVNASIGGTSDNTTVAASAASPTAAAAEISGPSAPDVDEVAKQAQTTLALDDMGKSVANDHELVVA